MSHPLQQPSFVLWIRITRHCGVRLPCCPNMKHASVIFVFMQHPLFLLRWELQGTLCGANLTMRCIISNGGSCMNNKTEEFFVRERYFNSISIYIQYFHFHIHIATVYPEEDYQPTKNTKRCYSSTYATDRKLARLVFQSI